MNSIWNARHEQGADTEEKLTSAILDLTLQLVPQYNLNNEMVVIKKDDIIELIEELSQIGTVQEVSQGSAA
jgi:hypothetical protein